jgi:Gas vesicle synthesis protein GvpL/GvpF
MARKRERDEAHILARLRPLAAAVEPQAELPEAVVLRASFLVETAKLDEFGATLDEVSQGLEGRARVKVVGPLPPYSFADVRLPVPEGA